MSPSFVHIEFFGIPRMRAGCADCAVDAGSVREVLRQLEGRFPSLSPLSEDGGLRPYYRLSLDGERFLIDLDETLAAGDRVLFLSADVGG